VEQVEAGLFSAELQELKALPITEMKARYNARRIEA
jgi:hypothetical protein